MESKMEDHQRQFFVLKKKVQLLESRIDKGKKGGWTDSPNCVETKVGQERSLGMEIYDTIDYQEGRGWVHRWCEDEECVVLPERGGCCGCLLWMH